MAKIHEFSCRTSSGESKSMAEYAGKVVLIVNTASKCGFAPQFGALEELYRKYHESGLVVLGFPCNQFGNQEPGSDAEALQFCQRNYGVSFPVFAKVEVNGDNADPLWKYLKRQARGVLGSEAVKWNFTKFLVDRDGNVVQRFAPASKPEELEDRIAQLIG